VIPNIRGEKHTRDYNTTIKENHSALAATTNIPQMNKHTQSSSMHDDQHTTVIPIASSEQIQSPADETPQIKTQEQEPQPTIARDSQNQNSMKEYKGNEHSVMSESTNDAGLEIIRRLK